MENIFEVNSLPLKEVIESLADSFNVAYNHKCEEYSVNVPKNLGSGEIRAINFENGLGIIIYKCCFIENVRIDFTVDDIHPVKYIYSVDGPIIHSFANESTLHIIEQNKCAIVASQSKNGHILKFEKNKNVHIVSLEIDREKFIKSASCELNSLADGLKSLFLDTEASKKFYHEGFFGLDFQNLLDNIWLYKGQALLRKFHLESNALQIFIKQLIQFEDDLKDENSRTILRINELQKIEEISSYITNNLSEKFTINSISRETGLNSNKLQTGFKYFHNSTVTDFIINQRLKEAKRLLSDPELSISNIVNQIGLENNSYFSKIFRKNFGMTPRDYRTGIFKN